MQIIVFNTRHPKAYSAHKTWSFMAKNSQNPPLLRWNSYGDVTMGLGIAARWQVAFPANPMRIRHPHSSII